MKEVIISILVLVTSGIVHAEQLSATGSINHVWTWTDKNPANGSSNVLALRLDNSLSNGCGYVWIASSNKTFLAEVMLAQATNKTVHLYYDNTIPSPWGDPAGCAALSIDF